MERPPTLTFKPGRSNRRTPGLRCARGFLPNSPSSVEQFEKAMSSVRKGVEHGYTNSDYLETEADIQPLQGLPDLKQALKEWRAKGRGRGSEDGRRMTNPRQSAQIEIRASEKQLRSLCVLR